MMKMERMNRRRMFMSGLFARFITEYVMHNWIMTISRTNNINVRAAVGFIASHAGNCLEICRLCRLYILEIYYNVWYFR